MNLEEARKTPFTFPGGYQINALMDDGTMLCHKCLQGDEVHEGGDADGWRFEAADIYWEGPTEFCAHCNAELPSEYSDPEEIENDA